MSTILVDAAAAVRLTKQFEAAIQRSPGRDMRTEARRFVSYLCDRLERNNRAMMMAAHRRDPQKAFESAHAARQGESVMMVCAFLMNDLVGRVGRASVSEFLQATQTRAGRALSRRIVARANEDVQIRAVRFSAGDGGFKAREILTSRAPFAGTNGAVADYRFRNGYPGALRIGLVVENEGDRMSHFVATHVRLFARYSKNEQWVKTNGEAFAFLEKVSALEGQVLAMRGFDCMDLLRGADPMNRDPIQLRILARLV